MIWPHLVAAGPLRIATFHAELTREGPGLLLRDIERMDDPQLEALRAIVETISPKVLFLTKVDFDAELRNARALQHLLGYAHAFALAPNTMRVTPLDLDADGRAGDRHGWARYAGEGAMLLLSQYPVKARFHLNDLSWQDVAPDTLPQLTGDIRHLKLFAQGLWVVDVHMDDEIRPTLALFQNQTPVFDGPEDLNGLRNLAQITALHQLLDGRFGPFPKQRFVLMGNANLDPDKGEGHRAALAALLRDPRLRDALPRSKSGNAATAYWDGPGPMRVSYILPSADWQIAGAGIVAPQTGPLHDYAKRASRHRLVWMDLMP